ncbi:MAG TPA: ABC transporter permease [Acidobacteriaceae bacterium]|nr:ABC transporter permease [Acidobacteriaceae bacterium]
MQSISNLFAPLVNDLRYALRQLRKSPGFSITAMLVLALGIGASAAMFTVIDAVLLRSLPYANAPRLVKLQVSYPKGEPTYGAKYPDIVEWQKKAKTIAGFAYTTKNTLLFIQGPDGVAGISTIQSSANLYALLGVQPQLGRSYSDAEQTPGRDRVVVLSDSLWDKLFHRDPHVLGKMVKLDGKPYTVIGVMPRGFSYPFTQTEEQVWMPLALTPDITTRNGPEPSVSVIARLRPGVSIRAAQAELDGLQHSIAREYPVNYGYPKPEGVCLELYRNSLVKQFRPALLTLLGACLMLWLVACANVASLMLVRSTVHQREIAVRSALGAGRLRLLRQSLAESLLLSFGGAAIGLGIAFAALGVFRHMLLAHVGMIRDVHINVVLLLALVGFSILTALVFGIVPASLASRSSLQVLQQSGTRVSAGRPQRRLRDLLMVAEIAFSLTLLVACGLLLRTLYSLRHMPLGIRTEHILTTDLKIPGYRYQDANVVTQLYRPLLERTQQLPDVKAASLSTTVPLNEAFWVQLSLYGDAEQAKTAPNPQNTLIDAQLGAASPGMQRVFGFRMLQGRFFNAQDTATSQPVAVVNQAFANEWSPGSSPLGKKFIGWGKSKNSRTVVIGVMDNLPQRSLVDPRGPQVILCLPQLGPDTRFYKAVADIHMQLAVRTREKPEAVIPEIRTILGQLAPELRGAKIQTMDQVVEDSLGDQRMAAHLLEIFGGTALLITLAGLYGSLLYMVGLRRREIAIRLAVGAQRRHVMRLVLSQAAAILAVGLATGIALSYASGRLLRGYLYGVHVHDVGTLIAVCLLFVIFGLSAAYLPARRAAAIDPIETLRSE